MLIGVCARSGRRMGNCTCYRRLAKSLLWTPRWSKIRLNRAAATTMTVFHLILSTRFNPITGFKCVFIVTFLYWRCFCCFVIDSVMICINCRIITPNCVIESVCSSSSQSSSSEMSESSAADTKSRNHPHPGSNSYHGLDFQLIVENKSGNGPGKVVHLVAPSMQDKAAWISDISQV